MNPAAARCRTGAPVRRLRLPASERPWLFALMIAPTGALANGVVQGWRAGLPAEQARSRQLADNRTCLRCSEFRHGCILCGGHCHRLFREASYPGLLIGGVSAGAMIAAAFRMSSTLTSRSAVALMLLSACLVQLVVSSCGGIMAELHSDRTRKRASGFYQAGLTGFGSLSAWVLVYMSSRVSQGTLGWFAGVMIALPALSVLATPAQQPLENGSFSQSGSFSESLRNVGVEFKHTFWARRAVPYLLYMLLPGCSGAAVGLLPGVAAQYRVGGDSVAWINGLAGGLLLAAGALSFAAVPWLLRIMRVHVSAMVVANVLYLINCAALAILWLGHLDARTYFIGVMLYLFTVGTGNAAFTAVILEFIGDAGESGSTRYSLINSLGNVPVQYMILADGWGADRFGVKGLTGTECVIGTLGSVAFLTWLMFRSRKASGASHP